ncbi:MAG: glycosyltransferase family A protein, partial [Bacteroidota bacterium]
TKAIVAQFDDPRIQYYYIEHVPFISEARNKIMELATGQYIAFLDSDDLWEPHKLATQLETINDFQADASFSNVNILLREGSSKMHGFPSNLSKQSTQEEILHQFVMNNLMVYTSSLILKKSVLEKLHRFDTYLSGSEMEFICRLINQFKVICDPACLVKIRKHDSNYSLLINVEELFFEKFWILEKLLKSGIISTKTYNRAMFVHYHAMIRSRNPNLKFSRIPYFLLKCIRMYPFSLINLKTFAWCIKILLFK